MSEPCVLYSSENNIATITLNRPNALNALNDDVVDALHEAFVRLNESDDRVGIVNGAGRAFCAGADMKNPPQKMWHCMPGLGIDLEKPVITAIHGHCIGGGYVLAQYTDLVVAADDAKISYPEAQIGYSGGMIMGVISRLPEKIAMEFLLLGQRVSAERAYQIGMVNRTVAKEQLLTAAMEFAEILANSAPLVVSALRKFAHETLPKSGPEHLAVAQRVLEKIALSEDRLEGQRAFKEKRTPVFTGK